MQPALEQRRGPSWWAVPLGLLRRLFLPLRGFGTSPGPPLAVGGLHRQPLSHQQHGASDSATLTFQMTGHCHGEETPPPTMASRKRLRQTRPMRRRDLRSPQRPFGTERPQRPEPSLTPRQLCPPKARGRHCGRPTFLFAPLGPRFQRAQGSHLLGRSKAWILGMLGAPPQSEPPQAKTEPSGDSEAHRYL